jgi:hypothetical protein
MSTASAFWPDLHWRSGCENDRRLATGALSHFENGVVASKRNWPRARSLPKFEQEGGTTGDKPGNWMRPNAGLEKGSIPERELERESLRGPTPTIATAIHGTSLLGDRLAS